MSRIQLLPDAVLCLHISFCLLSQAFVMSYQQLLLDDGIVLLIGIDVMYVVQRRHNCEIDRYRSAGVDEVTMQNI